MVFTKRFDSLKHSSGLLPTPSSPPVADLQADNYVGASLYPLPYEAVVVLEGCSLQDLLSWDLSVSTKSIKVKVHWSCHSNSSNGCILQEKLPKNLIKSLCLHDLARPSWSISSSQTKVSINFDWSISKAVPAISSKVSSSPNCPVSAYPFKTPIQPDIKSNFDSGYVSGNLTVGCQGPNFENWRRKSSPIPQPNFTTPSNPTKHDVYINPKAHTKSASNAFDSSSTRNSQSSKSPKLINSVSSVATTGLVNDYTEPKPKSSSLVDASSQSVCRVKSSMESPVNSTSSIDNSKSSKVSFSSNIHGSSSSVAEISKPITSADQKKPSITQSATTLDSDSSRSSSAPVNSSSTKERNTAMKSTVNPLKNVVVPTLSNLVDIPVPPKGFPKVFYEAPNPLPIVGDGFLDPNLFAFFMNIQGTCRLCNKSVSSYLIEAHILQCTGLNRQSLDKFIKVTMKETSLKKKQVVDAAILFSKFEMNEGTVPNKYFKNINKFRAFTREIENITKTLFDTAFEKLNISSKLQNFNILKYEP